MILASQNTAGVKARTDEYLRGRDAVSAAMTSGEIRIILTSYR